MTLLMRTRFIPQGLKTMFKECFLVPTLQKSRLVPVVFGITGALSFLTKQSRISTKFALPVQP